MGEVWGDRLPDDICRYFRANTMTGVASTIDQNGYPRGAPMSMYYALDDKHLLMGAQNGSLTFKNAVRRGSIALSFIVGGGTSSTVQGRVQLFKDTLKSSDLFGALLIEIESVKSNMDDGIEVVTDGIKVKFLTPGMSETVERVMVELRNYTLEEIIKALDIIRNPFFGDVI